MMYRPHAANRPGKMLQMLRTILSLGAVKGLDLLGKLGIYEAAQRENRRRDRANRRAEKHTTYFAAGLNGPRAVARRQRQIAAGQLQVTS